MSYDIYLCGKCLGPIWFPFGQKMHVGTGWYCWREEQERESEGEEIVDAVGEFIFGTEPQMLKELVSEACRLYDVWVAKSRKSQLVPFLQKQLRLHRSDVLHNFFRHLTREPPEHAGAVVREITITPEWRRFARLAITRETKRRERGKIRMELSKVPV
ncbi:MAG: hypothetical protein LAO21_19910 [Acidobacteriia bacterium]|nr:hypothetical protein [Terriglobia bacterium]